MNKKRNSSSNSSLFLLLLSSLVSDQLWEASTTYSSLEPGRDEMRSEKQLVSSPAGELFSCRRLALKFMVEGVLEVVEMRSMLVHEGWQVEASLRKGWHCRKGDK